MYKKKFPVQDNSGKVFTSKKIYYENIYSYYQTEYHKRKQNKQFFFFSFLMKKGEKKKVI